MNDRKAIVAGGLGATGRPLIKRLRGDGGWNVVGISRRTPEVDLGVPFRSIDLLDREACETGLADLTDIEHIFFAAYTHFADHAAVVEPNLRLLRNLVETVESRSPTLRSVVLVEGAKYYGIHRGPIPTPTRESQPRISPPMFYYDQEDWLQQQQQQKSWWWSVVRPLGVCGFAVGNPQNILTAIMVYGAICRELGLPLRFPGSTTAYNALRELTDADLLAQGMAWAATNSAAANETFNIANGTYYRWSDLWPRLAAMFGVAVEAGEPFSLADFMANKASVWDAMVAKYKLQPYGFDEIAAWPFADIFFAQNYDALFDTSKARRAGFQPFVDTEEMFQRYYRDWQRERILPA